MPDRRPPVDVKELGRRLKELRSDRSQNDVVRAIEATQQFRGLYHVLGGVISPMDGIGPGDLEIESLVQRVAAGGNAFVDMVCEEDLELALTQGQFILTPANSCLTLSLSKVWDRKLFELFSADCCLVIHNTEEFGERLHRAVQRTLPSWAGIDGAIEYGARGALGGSQPTSRRRPPRSR